MRDSGLVAESLGSENVDGLSTSCFAGSLSCHPLAETWQSRVVVPGFTSSRANTEHPRRKSLKQSLNDSFVRKFLIRFVLAICCDFNMTWYSLLQVVSPASIADTSGVSTIEVSLQR
ncbi:hypothetical protein PPTG_21404 [Phytophthora nicotianae INRA-310]|uniref:Uncharacterized protein n=1 Tax=Phytophthora nicotianae (strain INRA-310) TaxID=761204 RepID=W2R2X7_PHYN3|nr:hypothetical protein PPTG_21404 [Phytophthora nicotianae INRA-310]ETN19069.1 hypothetical protein PPTG_21404 [Phytophthora nicotianae INRA-310]